MFLIRDAVVVFISLMCSVNALRLHTDFTALKSLSTVKDDASPVQLLASTSTGNGTQNGNWTGPAYTCPSSSGRNDTTVEFITLSRNASDPAWPVYSVQAPTTLTEFMCGPIGGSSGYVLKWAHAHMKSFYFRSVTIPSEIFFLDKLASVLAFQSVGPYTKTPIVSPPATMYAVVLPAGAINVTSVQLGDPVAISYPTNSIQGGDFTLVDDKIGFHN